MVVTTGGKLRSRCDELVVKLDAVLASPVFNINFGTFTTFNCMNEDCGKTVRKRLPRGQAEVPVVCFECGAEHVVQVEPTGTHTVRPVVQDVSCANPECGHALSSYSGIKYGPEHIGNALNVAPSAGLALPCLQTRLYHKTQGELVSCAWMVAMVADWGVSETVALVRWRWLCGLDGAHIVQPRKPNGRMRRRCTTSVVRCLMPFLI